MRFQFMITKYRAHTLIYCLSMIDSVVPVVCKFIQLRPEHHRLDSLDCEIASVKSVGKIILKIRRLIAGTSPCPAANHHHGGAQDD